MASLEDSVIPARSHFPQPKVELYAFSPPQFMEAENRRNKDGNHAREETVKQATGEMKRI